MARFTPSHDPDQSLLLARAQAGDERGFRALVDPYRHALEVHCYRMLGSLQDAEDVAQETLLRAWRALERYEPRAQFQTWLYRIATNACLDELERRPRRPEPVDPFPDLGPRETASPIYDPAARYAIREGMELALLRAIQELPGRQRAVMSSAGRHPRSPRSSSRRSHRSTARCSARASRSSSVCPKQFDQQWIRPSANCSTVTSLRSSAPTWTGSWHCYARTQRFGCPRSRHWSVLSRSHSSSARRRPVI
jgi:RNA polymerase sigma factor (sigma-70 family)